MKRRWLFILLGGVAVLAIMGLLFQSQGTETTDLYVNPQNGPFQVAVTTTGELQAKNSVKIYGPRGSRQLRIFEMKILNLVPEGTVVEKGDFIAELDRSELSTRTNDSSLELQKAQSQYEQTMLDTSLTLREARDELINLRYAMEEEKIREEQATYEAPSVQRQAQINYEKAERAYEQAVENYDTKVKQGDAKMREVEAELSKSQNQYDQLMQAVATFTIKAPENGMVIYKRDWRGQKLTTGGTVNAWDPVVAELPDLSVMKSITYVNEVDIQKITVGQQVEIGLDADPGRRLTGTVEHVANIGEQRPNSDAKVFEVSIVVTEADTTLRPAMTTSNTIVIAELPLALYIPLETIHTQDSLNYVFVRRGGSTVRQEVQLGLLNENQAIVEGGLSEADRLYLSLPSDTTGLPLRRLERSEVFAKVGDQ